MDHSDSHAHHPDDIIQFVECDTPHWYGLKFADLDVPHQLPFLTEAELAQATPKITIDLAPGHYGIGGEQP
jgi:hypothetical protein